MRRCALLLILLALLSLGVTAQTRYVKGQTLVSDEFPQISVSVNKSFQYLGKFDFTLRNIAGGTRFVFVDADKQKNVKRLFIAQFEGFLPGIKHTYNYNFDKAPFIGKHKFRQNTFAYSNSASEREDPGNEGSLTAKFLREKGYKFEDEFMMSRFVTVPDAERRHELILFYIENVSTTGKTIVDFYSGDDETQIWRDISVGLTARSRKAFTIH